MLALSNVSAGYGGMDVIHDISLQVDDNLSIIGPNGCGKTTLLKTIANLLPFKGDISFEGRSFAQMKRREISQKIAMLAQQPGIYFDYPVFDTVMMGRFARLTAAGNSVDMHKQATTRPEAGRGFMSKIFGVQPTANDNAAVMEALEAVNLLAERDREITKLSGGQLQRVFLARTLVQEPRVILLDEPTNHLDLKCQIEIVGYLKKWAKKGCRAIVGVLHDINLAMELSGNILIMNGGEILAKGTAGEIITGGFLDRVYQMDVANHMRSSLERWGVQATQPPL